MFLFVSPSLAEPGFGTFGFRAKIPAVGQVDGGSRGVKDGLSQSQGQPLIARHAA